MSGKYALIIGLTEYQDETLTKLKSPSADVASLVDLFETQAYGSFDSVKSLFNPAFSDLQLSIAEFFAERKPDDMLLLYFSGHGVLDEQGRLYLAAQNSRRKLLSGSAISAKFITDEMDNCRSRRQVLILDCCHSGAFARGSKGSTELTAVNRTTFEGNGYGKVVLTATDATQYAWEGDQVIGDAVNSLFTHYLIEGVKTGRADADQDGKISLDELYNYIYDQMSQSTSRQKPRKWSYNQEGGQLVIALNPHARRPAPVIVKARGAVLEGGVRLEKIADIPFSAIQGMPAGVRKFSERLPYLADHFTLNEGATIIKLQVEEKKKFSAQVVFHQDGAKKSAISGSAAAWIARDQVWIKKSEQAEPQAMDQLLDGTPGQVAISTNPPRLAVATSQKIYLYDLDSQTLIAEAGVPNSYTKYSFDRLWFSPSGMLFGSKYASQTMWDGSTLEEILSFDRLRITAHYVSHCQAIDSTGQFFAASAMGQNLVIIDMQQKQLIMNQPIPVDGLSIGSDLAFLPNYQNILFFVNGSGEILLCDTARQTIRFLTTDTKKWKFCFFPYFTYDLFASIDEKSVCSLWKMIFSAG